MLQKFTFILCLLSFNLIYGQNNDCRDTIIICTNNQISFNPNGPGQVEDLNQSNNGCLGSNENSSAWYYFEMNSITPAGAKLGFTLTPDATQSEDYDFAVYGPNVTCEDLGMPLRCSFADGYCDFCPQTGMGMGATDFDDLDFDGFVAELEVNAGEGYFLLIDNFNESGSGFSIEWTGEGSDFLNCLQACDIFLLPIEDIVCASSTYDINLQVTTDVDSLMYLWEGDPTSITWLDDINIQNPTVDIPSGFSGQVTYTVTVSAMDNACVSTTDVTLNINSSLETIINETIRDGESLTVNNEMYTQEGTYQQSFQASNGCDSTLTINLEVIKPFVHYDLNACNAVVRPGNNADYSEFIATFPSTLSCADVNTTILRRLVPETYMHSCTPGINNSFAMCVSSSAACEYDAENPNAVLVDIEVAPQQGEMTRLTGIEFYEKAPVEYEWIGGLSGENNPPSQYGLRVLKDGVEIFSEIDIPTSSEWSLETFDFSNIEAFLISEPTSFTFEFLGYCTDVNGAAVTAWDLDEISILGNCELFNRRARSITGNIVTTEGEVLKSARINLFQNGTQANFAWSKNEGAFSFPDNPIFSGYIIQPEKDNDHLNGISTYDLVLIQKHILGVETFTSPYQYIAADINNNQTISAVDLVELRKVILGINKEFPNNKSWRFATTDQELSLNDPFNFEESKVIDRLEYTSHENNFIGIKIGDINGSAIAHVNKRETANNSNRLNLLFEDQNVSEGEMVQVAIYANDFEQINGLQLSLRPNQLTFEDVIPGKLNIAKSDIYSKNSSNLNISYSQGESVSIKNNEVLFTLQFKAEASNKLSELLKLNTKHLYAEVYQDKNGIEALALGLKAIDHDILTKEIIQLSNDPNPFSSISTIRFQLEVSEELNFYIFNVDGQQVYSANQLFEKGQNQIIVDKEKMNLDQGLYIYKIEGKQINAISKMILMN